MQPAGSVLSSMVPVSFMVTAESPDGAQRGAGMGNNLPEQSRYRLSSPVDARQLRRWCAIPATELLGHQELRVRFRQVADSVELGALMARELVEVVEENNKEGCATRAIVPCGPNSKGRSPGSAGVAVEL
jgi:hypothetical protein